MPPDLTDDGARAARRIRQTDPDVAIVLLSQHVETRHSVELVSSGGFGYLLKDRVLDVDEFLDALDRVAAGGSALDPEVVGRLIDQPSTPAALTPREREVLGLMAEGLTNVGIARRLSLTERTVETHVGSILTKLGLLADVEGTAVCSPCSPTSESASTLEPGQDREHAGPMPAPPCPACSAPGRTRTARGVQRPPPGVPREHRAIARRAGATATPLVAVPLRSHTHQATGKRSVVQAPE